MTIRIVGWSGGLVMVLSLMAREASGQACNSALEATATVVNMEEAGGVGVSVQRLTERALQPITHRGPAVRRDTTVQIRRTTITVHTFPLPVDHVEITVVYPD